MPTVVGDYVELFRTEGASSAASIFSIQISGAEVAKEYTVGVNYYQANSGFLVPATSTFDKGGGYVGANGFELEQLRSTQGSGASNVFRVKRTAGTGAYTVTVLVTGINNNSLVELNGTGTSAISSFGANAQVATGGSTTFGLLYDLVGLGPNKSASLIAGSNSANTNAAILQNTSGTTFLQADGANTKLTVSGSVSNVGNMVLTSIAAPSGTPTISNQGTAGSTSYSYVVTSRTKDGYESVVSNTATTATGNATLSGANFNRIGWSHVSGVYDYRVYRTASAGTPSSTGLVGTVLDSSQAYNTTGAVVNLSFDDTGIAGGAAAPTVQNGNNLKIGAVTTADSLTQLLIGTDNAGRKGLVVQGAVGQTADLLQIQNSSGTNLARFNENGVLIGNNGSGANNAGSALTIAGGQGTGSAVGGNILFQYAPAGGAGSSANALQTACSISGTNGSFSCPGSGSSSERFGAGSTAAGADALSIGAGTSANGVAATSIGRSATASGDAATVLGYAAQASGVNSTAIGRQSSTNYDYSTALGAFAATGAVDSIALGYFANTTAANQLVIGSGSSAIQNAFIGNGVTNAAPSGFTLQGTGGSVAGTTGAAVTIKGGAGSVTGTGGIGGALTLQGGNAGGTAGGAGGIVTLQSGSSAGTNIAGANTLINGGAGTGNAVGGNILFQYYTAGASGTTVSNTLQTACTISGTNGSLSCPGTGSTSERFGSGSVAAGNGSVAVGNGASSAGLNSIAIGPSASINTATSGGAAGIAIGSSTSSSYRGVAIGQTATNGTSDGSVAVGASTTATGPASIAIGLSANNTTGGIALGAGATTTANNQFVVGGSGFAIQDVYIGNGVTNTTPSGLTLQGSGSATAGTAGAAVTLKAGAGATTTTGSSGGDLTLQGGASGGSGNNQGGAVSIIGGVSTGTSTGSSVNITGGTAIGTNQNGGVVTIQGGAPTGSGAIGTINLNSATIATNATTVNLLNSTATTLSFAGAATTLNIGPTGASGSTLFSGGSADTGCTLNGVNGDLACSGNITGSNNGTAGYFSRNNGTSTLQPATAGDHITTSGNLSTSGTGTITSAGNLVVGTGATSNSTLQITGNTSFPTPTGEGHLFYHQTTDQLYIYTGSRWQADRTTATKIVAASDSQNKEKADYVADGTDDEVQINDAITALPATGGIVYLLEGTYTIDDNIDADDRGIEIDKSNVTLTGSGASTIIKLKNSVTGANIDAIADNAGAVINRITISNLKLDGNKANNASGTQRAIYFTSVGSGSGSSATSGPNINSIWAEQFRSNTIEFSASVNGSITNSTILANGTGAGDRTVYLGSSSSRINVVDNLIQGNTGYGILINTGSTNNTFSGNTIEGNGANGIFISSASDVNTIVGNTFAANAATAISLSITSKALVSGNSITTSGTHGIDLSSSTDNVVSSNRIAGSGTVTASSSGIDLGSSDSNAITGNYITDTAGTGYAININGSSDTNYLADNIYSGTGATSINDGATNTIYGGQLNSNNDFVLQGATRTLNQQDLEVLGTINNGSGGIGKFANLLTYSEQLEHANWGTYTNVTRPATSGTDLNVTGVPAPDGQTTVELLNASGAGTVAQTSSTAVGGTAYVFSVWLKSSTTSNRSVNIQIVGSGSGTCTAKSLIVTPNWQRFYTAACNTSAFTGNVRVVISQVASTDDVYAWGAQLVADSIPQAYVRTTASAVSQNQGVVSNGGLFVSSLIDTDKPLIVQAAPSQTADLFELQDTTGAEIASFAANGNLTTIGDAAINGGDLTSSAATVNLISSTTATLLNIGTGLTTGTVTIGGTAQTGVLTVGQSTANNTIDIGNATIATGNTGTIRIGTNATGTGKTVTTIGSTNDASAVTIQAGTGNIDIGATAQARATNIATGAAAQTAVVGSTNSTSTLNLQGGTGTATGDINIGDSTVAGKIIDIGSVTNAGTSTIRIATAAAVQTLTIGSTDTTSTTTIQGGTSSINLIANGSSNTGTKVTVSNNSTAAFQIQSASAADTLFRADTSGNIIKIGNDTGTTTATTQLILDNATTAPTADGSGVNGAMYYDSTLGRIQCYESGVWGRCSALNQTVTLVPEYPGAVLTADGAMGGNVGTMTSDFCSRTVGSIPDVNLSACPTAADKHNYYSWTAGASNDYDVVVRYQMPSDFAGFVSSTSIQMYGFRTGTNDSVDLTLFNDSGTVCGTASTVVSATNAIWTQTPLGGDETGCTIAAGSNVTFRIHMNIGTGGVSGTNFARAGELSFDYKSK